MFRKLSITALALLLVSSGSIVALAWTVNGRFIYYPTQADFVASVPGSAYWENQNSNGLGRLMYEANTKNENSGNNGDAFDQGDFSGISVSPGDLPEGFLDYSPNLSDWLHSEVGSDLVRLGPELVINDVTVQHKLTFFGDGEHVVRTEILLTAPTQTTRIIRTSVNLGSDGSTVAMAQYRDGTLTKNDYTTNPLNSQTAIANAIDSKTQWVVTSDNTSRTATGDPVIGTVLRGPISPAELTWNLVPQLSKPENGNSNKDYIQMYYKTVLPAGKTVSIVQFFKLHAYHNGVGNARFDSWLDEMGVFNTFDTGSLYFQNLTPGVQVLNWQELLEEVIIQKPKEIPPTMPLQVQAKPSGSRAINVSWQKPVTPGTNNISKYQIFRNGSLIATVSATTRTYRDRNLSPDQSYTYRVIALAGNLKSDLSRGSQAVFPRR